MKKINRHRLPALLLVLAQIISLLALPVGAAGMTEGIRWSEKSALSWSQRISDEASSIKKYYTLYDRDSGENISNPEPISYAMGQSLDNIFSLDLPTGRDWKNENNYRMRIYAQKTESEATDYQFVSISPSDTILNYHHFQKLERRYTTGSAMDSKKYVPSGTPLAEVNYYIVPQKYVQFAGVKPSYNEDGSQNNPYYTEEEETAIRALFPQYKEKAEAHTALKDYILSQPTLTIGGYHPQMAYRLLGRYPRNMYGQLTEQAFAGAVYDSGLDLAQAQEYIDVVMDDIYDYVESTRIDSPDITSFEIAVSSLAPEKPC